MKGKILQPPEYADLEGQLIFLAGPIQGSSDWHANAIEIISKISPEVNIASPRRYVGIKYVKGDFTPEMYNEQVDWETHYLNNAAKTGLVMFWLAKEFEHRCDRAYGQTSRFELGEWKVKHEKDKVKLVIGIEP